MKHTLRLLGLLALPAAAADPFAELVRPTEALPPDQERAAFHAPPGFEVQLVAAEPDLRKPMNMAFDAEGRLWLTESREYPHAAPVDKPGRDTVTILSDFGPDGRARSVRVFADGLNIPIGIHPYRDGFPATWKCLVWSIPHIWRLEDTDGDCRADKREIVYGPLGYQRDVHGNLASFRRGFDGWLYGTHGFNNESTFKGRDGSELKLTSGNTWRARLDGSRVEGHTWGQVNPFGLGFDPRGFLYSADCHSSPIYQLIPGGRYPSFGKPDDGLGFAPDCIKHAHGSTGIAGLVYLQDPAWPEEYRDTILIGNVCTSRINRDRIAFRGSSPKGREMPDFLTTDDPWFRPVDLQWGPDGALYIADFYNKIIGHYEVPLDHPGRDRERGRIWRVVWRGPDGKAPVPEMKPLPVDAPGLVAEMGSANPTRRLLALHALCDLSPEGLRAALAGGDPGNDAQAATLLWARARLGLLEEPALLEALRSPAPLTRAHALRVAAERAEWSAALAGQLHACLGEADPFAARLAAAALARHPESADPRALLARLASAPAEDDHLRYQLRRAIRDALAERDSALDGLDPTALDATARADLLSVLRALPGPASALWRMRALLGPAADPAEVTRQLPDLAAQLPAERVDELAGLLDAPFPSDATRGRALDALVPALSKRGLKPGPRLGEWISRLTLAALRNPGPPGWSDVPLAPGAASKPVWGLQPRPSTDGRTRSVMSSIVHGEKNTGILRSAPFPLPARLAFWMSGHDGFPDKPANLRNKARLVDAVSGELLREAPAPRNDTARQTVWTFDAGVGRSVRLEVVDADTANAYAWIAIGDIEPDLPGLALEDASTRGDRLRRACEMAGELGDPQWLAPVRALALSADEETALRVTAARAWVKLDNPGAGRELPPILNTLPAGTRTEMAEAVALTRSPAAAAALAVALAPEARPEQVRLANLLAAWPDGVAALEAAWTEGRAPRDLLRERGLVDKLRASNRPGLAEKLEAWRAALPPDDAERAKRIRDRLARYKPSEASAARGAAVFDRTCAVCHSLGGRGALVGPQLDGIGSRGLARLLEDILDPNRNIDRAFRLTLVTRNDGSVTGGLARREDEKTLVLADATGAEISIPKDQIRDRQESDTSLMPPAFADAIPEADFNDLLAHLLEARPRP